MLSLGSTMPVAPVALLAEGVDRNIGFFDSLQYPVPSPSSRRAWIEMASVCGISLKSLVALLAEGVDRNCAV